MCCYFSACVCIGVFSYCLIVEFIGSFVLVCLWLWCVCVGVFVSFVCCFYCVACVGLFSCFVVLCCV